jgi:hypothetical protein
MLLLLHHIVSACLGFALMSFLEYATHRWMLHKNHFVELFPRVREFKEVLTDHVVNHHGHFYKVFNHEEDTNGKWAGLFFPFGYYKLLTLFLATPLWFADHTSAYWCTVFFFMHFYFWNLFHKAMHFDETVPAIWRPWYRYVTYYHYLHHQHPNRNFNGCFPPLWDILLGTSARQTELDRQVWKQLQVGVRVDRRGREFINN